MRTIYLTSGDTVATVGGSAIDADHPGVGAGLMLDSEGRTVGLDLYAEVAPDQWVRADQLPTGMLAEERRRGTLTAGLMYNGKLYNKLNVNNVADKLIAAKVGLEAHANSYKGGATAFKAQLGDPMQQLAKQLLTLKVRLMEKEVGRLDREEMAAKIAKMSKDVDELVKDEGTKPEDDEPIIQPQQPFDFIRDMQRAFSGRTLTTAEINAVVLGQQIADLGLDESEPSLLGNPEKMASLRQLIAPLGGRTLAERQKGSRR